jgi:hypothetical protein
MTGWMGKAVKAVQGSNKAIIKKGSSVSTDKIPNGVVEIVEPKSKKVTVQSKDGKQRETIKSNGVRVKSDSVGAKYLSEEQKLNISEEEFRRKIIASGETGKGAADRLFPTDSLGDIRGRHLTYKYTKINPDLEYRSYKKNIFTREKELAAKELADQKQTEELVARQREFADKGKEAYEKKHTSKPDGNDPEFANDRSKIMKAYQKWKDTGRWAKGGSVNVEKSKKYREVENKYSNRMLPNKRKTTRIY